MPPAGPLNFILNFAQAVTYKLQSNNARLPVLPSGLAFNVQYVYNGTLASGGGSMQSLINIAGPLFLDGSPKQFISLIGEYAIVNTDAVNSLDVYIVSTASGTPGSVLYQTLPPGSFFNETNREINPGMIYLAPHAASTCKAGIYAWAYGSGQ